MSDNSLLSNFIRGRAEIMSRDNIFSWYGNFAYGRSFDSREWDKIVEMLQVALEVIHE